MQPPFESARDVSEYLLEGTGGALKSGDFGAFSCFVTLPLELQTFIGRRLLKSSDDLKLVFTAVRNLYEKNSVTDMVRHCVEAEFTAPDTIVATHETRLISGNVLIQRPFPVLSVLKLNGANWQVASSSYAIEDREDHNKALMCAGDEIPPSVLHR